MALDMMVSMSSEHSSSAPAQLFPRTRWSVVLAARERYSPESFSALESICKAYWYPLYVYVRRSGQSAHDAQDLTQAFFARLLEKHWLDAADPEKGRLRTFLITALKHFLSKEWRREAAQKRGGAREHVPFDTVLAEKMYSGEAPGAVPLDEAFDRQWALTLLDLTLKRLQAEFEMAGKPKDFEVLKGSLVAARGAIDYDILAAQLSINPGAARVAVHRLRKRFREIYREEIFQTLAKNVDLESELRHLAAALGGS
jgi:RNA polymerase sigma-70 factor (ECF subfamily)